MSNLIPKEKLTAYQRWEMASFDKNIVIEESKAAELAAKLQAAHQEKIEEEARRAAHGAGLEEGRNAGFEQGLAEGQAQGYADGLAQGRAEAETEKQQLQELARIFGDEIAQASDRVAADVLDLAMDLAKAMLKNALAIRPELVLPVVADAIRKLPSIQQPARIFLHPDDARLVMNRMGDELDKGGWHVIEDAHVERGGCRAETATNQIDATASSRWQRIAAALGKESDWLAE